MRAFLSHPNSAYIKTCFVTHPTCSKREINIRE